MKIKIAIVEDVASLRSRFKEMFRFYKDIQLIASYATGEAALNGLKKLPPSRIPDIILMDIALPKMSGIETTIAVKELYPDIEVIMLTVFEDEQKIFQSIQAGASGYLLKDDSPDSLVDAVRSLYKGGAPMSQSVAKIILEFTRRHVQQRAGSLSAESSPVEFILSDREKGILQGLVNGETCRSLAKKNFISPHTVKTHIKNIYKKLHVHSRANAVRVALQKNLI
ncbi:MAG: response regulator transcription factor [bacterium]